MVLMTTNHQGVARTLPDIPGTVSVTLTPTGVDPYSYCCGGGSPCAKNPFLSIFTASDFQNIRDTCLNTLEAAMKTFTTDYHTN